MITVVQCIEVEYGNAGRGGEGAARRARLPRGVVLPSFTGDTLFHVLRCAEWTNYEPAAQVSGLPVVDGQCEIKPWLLLRWVAGGVELFRRPSSSAWLRTNTIAIPAGQWTRVLKNEYRGNYDRRWHGDMTVNVGVFDHDPPHGVFLADPPELVDLRRDLLRKQNLRGLRS